MHVADLDEGAVVGRARLPGDSGGRVAAVYRRGEAWLENLEFQRIEEPTEGDVSVPLELLQEVRSRLMGEAQVHGSSG